KGASFSVYLPRVEHAAAAPDPGIEPAVKSFRGSETILLVEDEESVRKLANMFLQDNGYQVLAAGDGAQALQVARQHTGAIHLLLTDVVMPGINGRMLAERLAPGQPGMKI